MGFLSVLFFNFWQKMWDLHRDGACARFIFLMPNIFLHAFLHLISIILILL